MVQILEVVLWVASTCIVLVGCRTCQHTHAIVIVWKSLIQIEMFILIHYVLLVWLKRDLIISASLFQSVLPQLSSWFMIAEFATASCSITIIFVLYLTCFHGSLVPFRSEYSYIASLSFSSLCPLLKAPKGWGSFAHVACRAPALSLSLKTSNEVAECRLRSPGRILDLQSWCNCDIYLELEGGHYTGGRQNYAKSRTWCRLASQHDYMYTTHGQQCSPQYPMRKLDT